MEFGKLPENQLGDIDLALPPDAPITGKTLSTSNYDGPLQVYLGCSTWTQKVWKGRMYPAKIKDTELLTEYARHFNMIELNTTHYRMYDAAMIRKWKDKVAANPGFKFCPKVNQLISHIKRLKGADEITTSFLESMLAFEETLGPIFLQLSDNYAPKSFAEYEAYLRSLPRDLPIFTELRHKDWFGVPDHFNAAFNLMHELGIGAIITDTVGRRDVVHMALPTPDLFLRFVGNALHPTDYIRIDAWIERIKQWAGQGLRSVWLGMHQSDEMASPILCDHFIQRINHELGLKVARPMLTPGEAGDLFGQ
jgi:uncharacterized protein YecE (DUF72 family)